MSTKSRALKIVLLATAWGLSALLAGFVFVFVVLGPTDRVIALWPQPNSLRYGPAGSYTLLVVERETDIHQFPWAKAHEIVIGRKDVAQDYGHGVSFSFHPPSGDLEAHIRNSKVEWTDDGVTFIEATGHRLFIPEKMFVGGR
jgi:hypothetical protein